MLRATSLLIVGLMVLTTSSERSAEPGSAVGVQSSRASTNLQTFQVRGVVVAVKPKEKQVEIKHEEVPGYMPAMTMPFDVKDTHELSGLARGDAVVFRLLVTDTDGWIDQIRKLATPPVTNAVAATAPTGRPPTTGHFRLVREVEPLRLGDPLPEYRFTNELGLTFSTTQFKDDAVAINFIFTRCPFPAFCPRG